MNHLGFEGALLAAYHDTLLQRERSLGVHRSALAFFAGGLRTGASGAFTAVSLVDELSWWSDLEKGVTQGLLT